MACDGGLIDWHARSLTRVIDRTAVAAELEMRVELQCKPIASLGTRKREKTQSGSLPSHQTNNPNAHTLCIHCTHTHAHSWSRTMALGTMSPASKIHPVGLLLADIIPLILLSFNLSPHTQPTRAIMEIQKGSLVVYSTIRP